MDAYTICVPSGVASAHGALHVRLNSDVNDSGTSGLTTFQNVRRVSFREIDNLSPTVLSAKCKEVYKRVLDMQYAMAGDTPLRASPSPPLPSRDNDVGKALSRAWGYPW